MNEVRAHAARAALVQDDRFAFDPRQAADARTDRDAGALLQIIVHLGEAGILERLSGGVDAVDYEWIDLPLDLVVDALVGVETPFMILRLHFAGDGALLVARVETGDLPRPALAGDEVLPRRLDIATQRGDETQTGYDHTAHAILRLRLPERTTGPTR